MRALTIEIRALGYIEQCDSHGYVSSHSGLSFPITANFWTRSEYRTGEMTALCTAFQHAHLKLNSDLSGPLSR